MIVAAWIQWILPTDDKLGTFVAHLSNPGSFTKPKQRSFKKILKKCLDINVEQALPNLLRVTIIANNGLIELEELKQGYQFPGEKFTIGAMCWPIKYRNSFLRMINNWILTKRQFLTGSFKSGSRKHPCAFPSGVSGNLRCNMNTLCCTENEKNIHTLITPPFSLSLSHIHRYTCACRVCIMLLKTWGWISVYESFRTKISHLAVVRIARAFILKLVTCSHLSTYLKQLFSNLQVSPNYYINILGCPTN